MMLMSKHTDTFLPSRKSFLPRLTAIETEREKEKDRKKLLNKQVSRKKNIFCGCSFSMILYVSAFFISFHGKQNFILL